jgi:hypothetical protein
MQMPWGHLAGEVMAAMMATPERVLVGRLTRDLSLSRSAVRATERMSALLGRDGRPNLEDRSFLCDCRSPSVLISPAIMASTILLSSDRSASGSLHARSASFILSYRSHTFDNNLLDLTPSLWHVIPSSAGLPGI